MNMKLMRVPIMPLCIILTFASVSAAPNGYKVKYSGGSLEDIKSGEDLTLFFDAGKVRLKHKKSEALSIPPSAITEVSYGQEVHRRIGAAAGLAVVSLGIGALVAFSKSKKHYIGVTWDDGKGQKGGLSLQCDKNEFRGLLAAFNGVTGKKAVDADVEAKKVKGTSSE